MSRNGEYIWQSMATSTTGLTDQKMSHWIQICRRQAATYSGHFSGTWYALQHSQCVCIVIILFNANTSLTNYFDFLISRWFDVRIDIQTSGPF